MRARFMVAAISLVAQVVNKHNETGESTSSVFYGELMAVLVPYAGFWEVFGMPVGTLKGVLEHLKM